MGVGVKTCVTSLMDNPVCVNSKSNECTDVSALNTTTRIHFILPRTGSYSLRPLHDIRRRTPYFRNNLSNQRGRRCKYRLPWDGFNFGSGPPDADTLFGERKGLQGLLSPKSEYSGLLHKKCNIDIYNGVSLSGFPDNETPNIVFH